MEIEHAGNKIKLEKEWNSLDYFVVDFVEVLNKLNIKYVIVSGYVAILFGRSRSSEDIDIFIENLSFENFRKLWDKLMKKFECIVTGNERDAYYEYLQGNTAIRFSHKGQFIPNVEIKFPKIELEEWALENRTKVELNGQLLHISSIELQIAFKLFLHSEKDIEDAKYLYEVFRNNVNFKFLQQLNQKIQVEEIFRRYIE